MFLLMMTLVYVSMHFFSLTIRQNRMKRLKHIDVFFCSHMQHTVNIQIEEHNSYWLKQLGVIICDQLFSITF